MNQTAPHIPRGKIAGIHPYYSCLVPQITKLFEEEFERDCIIHYWHWGCNVKFIIAVKRYFVICYSSINNQTNRRIEGFIEYSYCQLPVWNIILIGQCIYISKKIYFEFKTDIMSIQFSGYGNFDCIDEVNWIKMLSN